MAILDFQKPEKVIQLHADEFYGKFEFRPLEPGFGMTIGNALRRILLSSLEGFAITRIKIEGVDHEFSTITGVVEDVTEIVLNLKQVRFRRTTEDTNVSNETVYLTITGKDEFKAGDIDSYLTNFEVINKDHIICTLEPFVKLQMHIEIEKGRGYIQAEDNEDENSEFGVVAIDSIFTPIKNVNYAIDNYRVGRKTDYEKLTLEINTDGSIHPKDALQEAAKILIYHFMLFSDEKITVETEEKKNIKEFDEEYLRIRQILKKKLVDMDLSVRALNCLKGADVHNVGDLVKYQKDDLLKFRNFGRKSLAELEQLVENLNLEFGTEISKYKLDED